MRLWTPRWAMFGLIRKTEPDRRFRRSDDWRKFFRAATFIISSGVPEVSENWVCLQIEHEAKSGKCSGRGFQTARLIMPFSLDLTVPGNSQSKISGPKSKTAFICAMTQMIPSDFNGLQIIISALFWVIYYRKQVRRKAGCCRNYLISTKKQTLDCMKR